jgi:hypothetical protein
LLPLWRAEAYFRRITKFPPEQAPQGESGGKPPHSKEPLELGNELLGHHSSASWVSRSLTFGICRFVPLHFFLDTLTTLR